MVGTGLFSNSKIICGLKSAFLSGISYAILMFFGAVQSPAAPVESASGTIYILLGTQGTAANPSSNLSVNAIKSYIQDNITGGDTSLIHVSSYNLGWNTPAVFARDSLDWTSGHSLLDSALAGWFKNTKDSRVSAWKKKNSGKKSQICVMPVRIWYLHGSRSLRMVLPGLPCENISKGQTTGAI